MPYDNKLNREISQQLNKIYMKFFENTPFSYEYGESNVGTSNKKIIDESNIEKETQQLKDKELSGGALGAVGGFAKGTIRDTGEGEKTLGAGKKHKKEESGLLLKRQMEGGNIGLLNMAKEKMEDKVKEIKKRGRPNKMRGGTDLAEPYNMVRKDGTTGYGKLDRVVGGNLKVSSQNKGSSMSGFGKKNRAEIVKKVMKERGVSLPVASSIVKKEKLY